MLKRAPVPSNLPTSPQQMIREPWVYVGMGRSAFFRLVSTGNGPKSVRLANSTRKYFRQADLDAWLASLATG